MKNHLFIGLGGQGGKSLAELRKVIEQREADAQFLRQQDIRWDFLYVDSSLDVKNTRANWTHFGKNLALDPADFVHLKDGGQDPSAAVMKLRPDVAPWIGDPAIVDGFLRGAGQIEGANQRRRFGRLLFANHADKVRSAIVDGKVERLTQARSNQCCFHIFASLAGGTGSGSIIDLITLLRTRYPESALDHGFPIILYLYVTSDEVATAEVGYFHQNQFAALRDLNALACGRLQPHLLGMRDGGRLFSHNEPINEIVLSSSLNDQNQKLSIQRQHRILSESAFERIFCYCSGNLNEDQQRSLTGQDILANFRGEPINRPQRSYRFSTIGMRRWEVPTEEVQELLANELYVSAFRQMLYENWQDGYGYQESGPISASGAGILDSLRRNLSACLVGTSEVPALEKALNDDFSLTFRGIVQDIKKTDLDEVESKLQDRYNNNLKTEGVGSLFGGFAQQRPSRMATLRAQIHSVLSAAWLNAKSPLGLSHVRDILLSFQDEVRKMLEADSAGPKGGNERLKSRMAARKAEWTKITILSAFLKRKELAEAHRNDVQSLRLSDLHERAAIEDRAFLTSLIGELATLDQHYYDATGKLKAFEQKAMERRDVLFDGLRGLQSTDTANKYELDLPALEEFSRLVRTNSTHMRNTAEMMRRVIAEVMANETLANIKDLAGAREEALWEKLDSLCYSRVKAIHDDLEAKHLTPPILGSSLLTRLQAKYDKNEAEFSIELRNFIDLATSCTRIDRNQMQPAVLEGGGHGIPRMPRRMLVLGLPKNHAFSEKLNRIFDRLMHAGEALIRGTYYHEDPTQIRLLVVDSWMAARFAFVVSALEKMYLHAVSQNSAGDIAYFTNIDPTGQQNRRPPILLPSPEQGDSLLRAELWLGCRLYNDPSRAAAGSELLIQTNESGVFLVLETAEGAKPERLGADETQTIAGADVRLMSKVHDAVTGAVSRLDQSGIESLRQKVNDEDQRIRSQGGPLSEPYLAWIKKRDEIHNLLSQ